MPGLFCSGMGALLCRSRMDSHCTDRRGVQRGKAPLALGHPIGASSIPVGKGSLEGNSVPLGGRFPKEGSAFLGTRLSLGKSSVLYLCFRLTPGRGWLRHLQPGQMSSGQTLFGVSRTGGFCRVTDEIGICTGGKTRLPWGPCKTKFCGERRSSGVSELSHLCGSEGYRACDDAGSKGIPTPVPPQRQHPR